MHLNVNSPSGALMSTPFREPNRMALNPYLVLV